MNIFRTIILVTTIIILSTEIYGQNSSFPKGCYMNFEEFVKKTPSHFYEITMDKVDSAYIRKFGGNDYYPSFEEQSKKLIHKQIFAISDGNNAYLNCNRYGYQKGYAKFETEGNYKVFIAGASKDEVESKGSGGVLASAMFGGLIGGAVAGALAYDVRMHIKTARFLYLLDTNTNTIYRLNSTILKSLLRNHQDLFDSYERQPEQHSAAIMIEYINRLNERLSYSE